MLSVGSTFLIPTPSSSNEHLFIIVAIQECSNTALLVNVATPKIGCDETCRLNVGEHPFLKWNSVIDYAYARITPISNLEYCLKTNTIKKDSPVSGQLLKKIQDGALASPSIPKRHLNFLLQNI